MPSPIEIKQIENPKSMIRKYLIDFLKKNSKGLTSREFEILSQFENYIVERMNENAKTY